MTQQEIAKNIGISGAHYSCIINNKVPVGKTSAVKIGKYLNINWYDVFKLNGQEIHEAAVKVSKIKKLLTN